MDDLPVDDLDDLAGHSQSLLWSQDRLSQDLRPSCLSQLWPSMRHWEIAETWTIEPPSLGPL